MGIDAQLKPQLAELTGENLKYRISSKQKESCLNIPARNLRRFGDKYFFDVRVFNPTSKLYKKRPLKVHI